MDVYLNGTFIQQEKATLSAMDAGVQHGVGLFETMFACHGQVFRLEQHLSRLNQSAQTLGLTYTLDIEKLSLAVQETLAHNKLEQARIRLTVTAGDISLLRENPDNKKTLEPTILIVPSEPMHYDETYFEKGIIVAISQPTANPFDQTAGHKTLNYWERLRTLRAAAAIGAGEAIWLNISNHLASGAVSNIFLVKDEALLTPIAKGEEIPDALPAPVLPGITRGAVIELAEQLDLPVYQRMLTIDDLLEADEIFLTNSGWQILPVRQVEKETVGTGQAGPITLQLRSKLLALIEAETLQASIAKPAL